MNPSPEARHLLQEPQFFVERRSRTRRFADALWRISWPAVALGLLLVWFSYQ